MAKAFDWIGARTWPNYEWPEPLMRLYEACRAAYDLESAIEGASRRQDRGTPARYSLGELEFDAMGVWMRLEQVAAPLFAAWERQHELLSFYGAAHALRVAPRTVPVLARDATEYAKE